jgi:hypothetical protein
VTDINYHNGAFNGTTIVGYPYELDSDTWARPNEIELVGPNDAQKEIDRVKVSDSTVKWMRETIGAEPLIDYVLIIDYPTAGIMTRPIQISQNQLAAIREILGD